MARVASVMAAIFMVNVALLWLVKNVIFILGLSLKCGCLCVREVDRLLF